MSTQNRVKGIIQNECENSVHNLEPTLNIHGLDSLLCFWCASKYFDKLNQWLYYGVAVASLCFVLSLEIYWTT